MTNTLTMIFLTIFLASCNAPKIKSQPMGDISFKFNRCRMRCYDITEIKETKKKKCDITKRLPKEWPDFYSLETKPNDRDYLRFNPGKYPLRVCDKLVGFHVDVVAKKIIPWGKKTLQYYRDQER